MNKIYRVVWSAELGQWVVASEVAKGRKKKASAGTGGAAMLVLAAAVGGAGLSGQASAAIANSGAIDVCKQGSTTGYDLTANGLWQGGICDGTSKAGVGALGGTSGTQVMASLMTYGSGGYADLSAVNNVNIWSSNQKVTLEGGAGIDLKSTTSLTGHKLVNLATGTADSDAVNLGQLKAVEAKIGSGNGTDTNALHYDAGSNSTKATLAGTGGTTIANVKDGTLADGSKEAVNAGQLFTTNQNVTNLTNNYNTLSTKVEGLNDNALMWNGAAYNATRQGEDRTINGVAAGAVTLTSSDAINGSQLYGTAKSVADALGGGSTVEADGKIGTPTYTVDKKTQTGVQAAIAALDARFDNLPAGSDALKWDAGASAYDAQRDGANRRHQDR